MDTPLPHPHFPKIRALLTGNVDSWIHCRGTITVIVTTFHMIFSLPDIALFYLSSHLTTILLSSIGWRGLEETCFVSSRVSRVGRELPPLPWQLVPPSSHFTEVLASLLNLLPQPSSSRAGTGSDLFLPLEPLGQCTVQNT